MAPAGATRSSSEVKEPACIQLLRLKHRGLILGCLLCTFHLLYEQISLALSPSISRILSLPKSIISYPTHLPAPVLSDYSRRAATGIWKERQYVYVNPSLTTPRWLPTTCRTRRTVLFSYKTLGAPGLAPGPPPGPSPARLSSPWVSHVAS